MTAQLPPRWLALWIPERGAVCLNLVPGDDWPDLEYFGLTRQGGGRRALVHVSHRTAERLLDRARFLWSRRRRRDPQHRPYFDHTDRRALQVTIGRLERALLTHEREVTP